MATNRQEIMEKAWLELKERLKREIQPEDFQKMKASSTVNQSLAERDLDLITSPLTLLEKIQPQKIASLDNLLILIDILEDIDRTDLVHEVIETLEKEYGRFGNYGYNAVAYNYTESISFVETLKRAVYFGGLGVAVAGPYGLICFFLAFVYNAIEHLISRYCCVPRDYDLGFSYRLQASFQNDETRKKVFRGRVMLVGAYGAGKTSTKRSLFNEPCQKKHLSTDGADVYSIDITEWIIKESSADYKGDKSLEETQKILGDILVHGVTRMKGGRCENEHKATKAEVGQVFDAVKLKGERVSQTYMRLRDLAKRESLKKDMKTPKSDVYFSLWDFAGQTVYYITHQVFLASRVIYILVIDLTKSLDDIIYVHDGENWTVKQFLNFWINSIHTHATKGSSVNCKQSDGSNTTTTAPPVIILGTKKDLLRKTKDGDVDEEATKRLLEIKAYLSTHATRPVHAHVVKTIAIDNMSRKRDGTTADPSVDDLRETLQDLAADNFFHGEVPAKWIHLEVLLRKMRKEKMSLDEVKKIGKGISMEEAEVMEALEFYHGVGEILHFQSVPELQDTIILNVVWLVNLFKILITQSLKHKEEPATPTRVIGLIDKLHQEGILHEDLLDYLLKRHNRLDDKTMLLIVMEMYDIICEKPVKSEERRMYYLPSLMQQDAKRDDSCIPLESSSVYCQLYFHFIGNFLPEGLFYRLLIRCIRRWPNCAEVVTKHMARLYFKCFDFHLTMSMEGADIKLNILVDGQQSSPPYAQDVTILREVIEEELHVVIEGYAPTVEYKACLKCENPNHKAGKLLSNCDDTDDKCVLVREGEMAGVCEICAVPLKDMKLNMWYWQEGEHKKESLERASCQAFEGLYPLSTLFSNLDKMLTRREKCQMVSLLRPKQINERDAEKLETPIDVFHHLRKQGNISVNNLELLKDVFRQMDRNPLVACIDDYLQKQKMCNL